MDSRAHNAEPENLGIVHVRLIHWALRCIALCHAEKRLLVLPVVRMSQILNQPLHRDIAWNAVLDPLLVLCRLRHERTALPELDSLESVECCRILERLCQPTKHLISASFSCCHAARSRVRDPDRLDVAHQL